MRKAKEGSGGQRSETRGNLPTSVEWTHPRVHQIHGGTGRHADVKQPPVLGTLQLGAKIRWPACLE